MTTWTQFFPFLTTTYHYVNNFKLERGQKWRFFGLSTTSSCPRSHWMSLALRKLINQSKFVLHDYDSWNNYIYSFYFSEASKQKSLVSKPSKEINMTPGKLRGPTTPVKSRTTPTTKKATPADKKATPKTSKVVYFRVKSFKKWQSKPPKIR